MNNHFSPLSFFTAIAICFIFIFGFAASGTEAKVIYLVAVFSYLGGAIVTGATGSYNLTSKDQIGWSIIAGILSPLLALKELLTGFGKLFAYLHKLEK